MGIACCSPASLFRRRLFVSRLLTVLATSVVLLLATALRWPALGRDVFLDEETADIAYGADLLRHGRLPAVHSAETRAPGAAFVAWGVWAARGRSLQSLAAFNLSWTLLATVGVVALGALLFGGASGVVAGCVYALGMPPLDRMAPGYWSWAITFCIWSGVLLMWGLRRASPWWILASGVLLAWAALLKHQSALLLPAHLGILALGPSLARWQDWPVTRRRWLWHFLGGIGLGVLPLVGFYVLRGGLGAFLQQYLLNGDAWRSLAAAGNSEQKIARIQDGLSGVWSFTPLPALLAAMSLVALPTRSRGPWSPVGVYLAGATIAGLVAALCGLRFLPSYYVVLMMVMALMAGHPDGPVLRWCQGEPAGGRWERACRVGLIFVLILALIPAVLIQGRRLYELRKRVDVAPGEQLALKRTGATIAARSRGNDSRIWAFGWPAQALYFYANQRAASRYYRTAGIVTNPPTHTWRRGADLHFERRGPWRRLTRDLVQGRPAFIALTRRQSFADWQELGQLLRQQYEPVPSLSTGEVLIYARKDKKP